MLWSRLNQFLQCKGNKSDEFNSMNGIKLNWRVNIVIILLLIIGIYYFISSPRIETHYNPDIIRIGAMPDDSPTILRARFSRLVEYLTNETQLQFELIIPDSYSDLLRLFGEHQVDLAYFGGLTFIRAEHKFAALPIVMREVDTRFTSWFLVKADNTAESITDLKGKTFSFGSKYSTSGHLMPRHFLNTEYKITPEDYFSEVSHSARHDATAYRVQDGVVDLGVVNSQVVQTMLKDGRLDINKIRILWETPPYPDYVWAIQNGLDTTVKNKIRDAFLTLKEKNPEHALILEDMGTNTFYPAGINDYSILRQVAEERNMLD